MAKMCKLVRVLVFVVCMNTLSGGFALAASASPTSIGILRLERDGERSLQVQCLRETCK